ncbi:MAG: Sua5 family C-terminal domain-containing protein, partial [Burkholderiaceae bacterium]
LRPGHIGAEQLAEVLGTVPRPPDAAAPRASGTLAAHYAPKTPLVLAAAADLPALRARLAEAGRRVALIGHGTVPDGPPAIASIGLPTHAAGYAQALYATLRAMDAAGAELILIETPPLGDDWRAVHDRLRRAAHDSAGILEKIL